MDEIFGFGPLQPSIDNDDIAEIMVNGPYIIFIERDGCLVESGYKFLDDDPVERVIKRIVVPFSQFHGSSCTS